MGHFVAALNAIGKLMMMNHKFRLIWCIFRHPFTDSFVRKHEDGHYEVFEKE